MADLAPDVLGWSWVVTVSLLLSFSIAYVFLFDQETNRGHENLQKACFYLAIISLIILVFESFFSEREKNNGDKKIDWRLFMAVAGYLAITILTIYNFFPGQTPCPHTLGMDAQMAATAVTLLGIALLAINV